MATVNPVAARPLPRHLGRIAVAGAVVAFLIALVVSALAASRATAHVLSPAGLAGVVAGAAAALVFVGWVNALYAGAADVLSGEAVLECGRGCRSVPRDDPWAGRRLWLGALAWSAVAAAWALAGAGLVAVALDGKRARLVVVLAAFAGLAGTAAVVVEVLGRHRGAHAARRALDGAWTRTSVRRRAWRQIAVPVALGQAVVNGAMAWLLFHDYARGAAAAAAGGTHALTRSVVTADFVVMVVLLSVVFSSMARRWGAADAELGRITLDDADAQAVPAKAPIGAQGVLYVAVATFIVGRLTGSLLPSGPTLLLAALARALFAGVLAYIVAGVSYTRGAVNAMGAQSATQLGARSGT
jgi:hypothetical protein